MKLSLVKVRGCGPPKTSLTRLTRRRLNSTQSTKYWKSKASSHYVYSFDAEIADLLNLGRHFSRIDDRLEDWLTRRVDTSHLRDSIAKSSDIRTSLMIDGAKFRRACSEFSERSPYYIPLPAQKKRLLGKFDATVDGVSIPIATRGDNAHIAVGRILLDARLYLREESAGPSRRDLKFERLVSREMVDGLYLLATCAPNGSEAEVFRALIDATPNPESKAEMRRRLQAAMKLISSEIQMKCLSIFVLIETIRIHSGENAATSIRQRLDFYLKNFVPIAIVNSLHKDEFIVKFEVSDIPTPQHPSELAPRLDLHAINVNGCAARGALATCLAIVISAAMISRDLNMALFSVPIMVLSIIFAVMLRSFLTLSRRRSIRWIVGAYAYASYLSLVHRLGGYFPSVRLSGNQYLRSAGTNLGLRGSQHLHMMIPDGARAISIHLLDEDDNPARPSEYEESRSPDRVAVHTFRNADNASSYDLRVEMIPSTHAFLMQAFYAAVVTFILFLAGILAEILGYLNARGCRLSLQCSEVYGLEDIAARSSGSIVTILAIAPSIYTIILLQKDEHSFVSDMYRNLRRVVGFCAVISASVAIPIALDMPWGLVIAWWAVGFLAAWFSCWHVAATRFYHGAIEREGRG